MPSSVKSSIHFGEELAIVMDTNVLEHPDRNDAVEALRDIAIVAQLKAGTIGEAELFCLLICQRALLLRERDAQHAYVLHAREIQRHVAPSAADIENALAGLQIELRGDEAELVLLGILKRVVVVDEVGAGVLHPFVQEETIEVIADVIVMGDILLRLTDGI